MGVPLLMRLSIISIEKNGKVPTKAYETIKDELTQSDIYWAGYGTTLLMQKNYTEAIEKFKIASSIKSYPDTYLKMAFCYQKVGNYDSAIALCNLAKNIVPNRIMPRFAKMKIYEELKDTALAVSIANEIINIQPKIKSDKAVYYKREAEKIIAAFKK